ncbi:type VI secretion system baseplate subunit TssG [Mesorhizobium sp. 1B3]|uniref:type VI secretion system baseplate subunit TssG n=1 Tax=Mesorhizobium sp. 1B3 TaxID=3243599 RepID=UPI003D98E8C8
MASTRRRSRSSLAASLFEQPQAYEFFQLVRLRELIAALECEATGSPPPDPIGSGVEPRKSALTIRSAVPLGFAAAEVTALRRPRQGGPVEATQTLVGLTGPSGVLSHALSELVQLSVRERNPALRDFLDVFNNRLAGLLYEAWVKYRPVIARERALRLGASNTIDTAFKALVGIGMPSVSSRMKMPDETLVHFGGLLSKQGRSVVAVERALSGALGHRVKIRQFFGEWLPIAEADQTRLPRGRSEVGHFTTLGKDAVLGTRTFDIQSSVLVRVGPLSYPAFRSLLPDGLRASMLSDLAAMALGADKSFRIRLELDGAQVPMLRLGGNRDDASASRLGWNTWLASDRPRTSSAFAEFRPPAHLR